MSVVATTTLQEQEGIVERGLASFVEVGNALRRIRDEEFYREAGFDGFVEYLESKPWGIGANAAYKQIQAAEVAAICTTVQTESQARELAPLMRKATPQVVKRIYAEIIEETGGKPTAAAIREKVQPLLHRNGKKEVPADKPSQYLPDLLDEDSPRNLRTQIVRWCELGLHIESLLDNRAKLDPKSDEDLRLIRAAVSSMRKFVDKLERRIS